MGVRCAFGSDSKCVATAGVPTRMLRNLGILKILLLRPTRSDQYKAGPDEVSLTAIKVMAKGTANTNSAIAAKHKSIIRLTFKKKPYSI